MTAKELAALIDGREYGNELSREEIRTAKDSGLVIVNGVSDDLVEICGAIDDEADCFEGGIIRLDKHGLTWPGHRSDNAREIRAVWHDKGNPCWTYETDIPHETFRIMEDGEVYCEGIVFSVEDLQ